MANFLNFDLLRSAVIVNGSIALLVKEAEQKHGVSPSMIRRCWSLLCRYGFSLDQQNGATSWQGSQFHDLEQSRDRCPESAERDFTWKEIGIWQSTTFTVSCRMTSTAPGTF